VRTARGNGITAAYLSLPRATPKQREIADKLGITVSGDTFAVAAARILDVVGRAVGDECRYDTPTDKQVRFAGQLGIDISHDSFRVGSAKLDDELALLDMRQIAVQELGPGVKVRLKSRPGLPSRVISSIQNGRLVFFRGGGGAKAWARNCVRVDE
jgi:hypothetical protein